MSKMSLYIVITPMLTFDDIAEVDHVVDRAPAMFAHPTAAAAAVGLDGRTGDVPAVVVRRTDPVVGVLGSMRMRLCCAGTIFEDLLLKLPGR